MNAEFTGVTGIKPLKWTFRYFTTIHTLCEILTSSELADIKESHQDILL